MILDTLVIGMSAEPVGAISALADSVNWAAISVLGQEAHGGEGSPWLWLVIGGCALAGVAIAKQKAGSVDG